MTHVTNNHIKFCLEKSGFVEYTAFIQLLQLNQIKLSFEDQAYLKA